MVRGSLTITHAKVMDSRMIMIQNWFYYWLKRLFTRKTMHDLEKDVTNEEMKRSLNVWQLTALGIGGIIGTGIFVLSGEAAAKFAGPAVIVSFIVAGCAAGLAAMSYSEMASMVPVSGSAYTYTYATMGEFLAWIIGWDLILEYLVGAATVAVGWSGYVCAFFKQAFGIQAKEWIVTAPVSWNETSQSFYVTGQVINLPAMLIVLALTLLLIIGIGESATVNTIIVVIKVLVVLLFIFAACKFVDPHNYTPFFPPNKGSFNSFGVTGMLHGATVVFFAYIGFDAITTTAQESKNPQRDLPIGIITSLVVSTILYIAVCLVLVGVVSYKDLNVPNPISVAIEATHVGKWLAIIVDLGAIAGLTSVLLVNLMGQPRIFYCMAHDGLFPLFIAQIHPRFRTPWVSTLITGVLCAACAGVLPIDVLGEMTSIGTLLAFFLVHIGIIIMRFTHKDTPRRFRVPGGPWFIPPLGAAVCLLLMITSSKATGIRLVVWLVIGLIIYFCYGIRNSKLRRGHQSVDAPFANNNTVKKNDVVMDEFAKPSIPAS